MISLREKNQNLQVKNYSFYLNSIVWSILTCVWLYIILNITSPNSVDIWEALFLVILYPIFSILAVLLERSNKKKLKSLYFNSQSSNVSEISSNSSNNLTIEGN